MLTILERTPQAFEKASIGREPRVSLYQSQVKFYDSLVLRKSVVDICEFEGTPFGLGQVWRSMQQMSRNTFVRDRRRAQF